MGTINWTDSDIKKMSDAEWRLYTVIRFDSLEDKIDSCAPCRKSVSNLKRLAAVVSVVTSGLIIVIGALCKKTWGI